MDVIEGGAMKKMLYVSVICGIVHIPYVECMRGSSPLSPPPVGSPQKLARLKAAVKAHVDRFNLSAAFDKNFVSLLDAVAFGSYKEAESFRDDVAFRTNLAGQLLVKIFNPEVPIEDIALQKAGLICAALGDSSKESELRLLEQYRIKELIVSRPEVKGALVTTYFDMKKMTNSICLTTLMWSFLYTINAVNTRYE